MHADYRYDCALAAALAILDLYDHCPAGPKHHMLANVVFAILHAMDRYEEGRSGRHVGFSDN